MCVCVCEIKKITTRLNNTRLIIDMIDEVYSVNSKIYIEKEIKKLIQNI